MGGLVRLSGGGLEISTFTVTVYGDPLIFLGTGLGEWGGEEETSRGGGWIVFSRLCLFTIFQCLSWFGEDLNVKYINESDLIRCLDGWIDDG